MLAGGLILWATIYCRLFYIQKITSISFNSFLSIIHYNTKLMQFRNFKMVDYVVYGRGSFNQLDEILAPQRKGDAPMIFLVDHFFEGKALANRVPLRGKDKIVFVDVTYEPKTTQVDALAKELKDEFGTVSGIIGIGGGSAMDLAKAVSLMMTNTGSSADYQGWDLVKLNLVFIK
jgi:3-deoxy-alpha-D-manno-octulosonate 8-oxidase